MQKRGAVVCSNVQRRLFLCFALYQVPGLIGKTKATRFWPCGLLFLVGLSDVDTNNYNRLIRYKSSLNKSRQPQENQPIVSSDRDLDVSEKVVTKLRQEQARLDDCTIKQLIIDYKNGLNMNELARKYNCHRTTISQKLRMSGVTIRRLPPNDEQIDRMVTLYQSGLSLEAVGNKIGVSASTVSRYITKRGVTTRDEHGRVK